MKKELPACPVEITMSLIGDNGEITIEKKIIIFKGGKNNE